MVKDFYSLQGFRKCSEDEEGNTVWEFLITDDYEKKNQVIEVNNSRQTNKTDSILRRNRD